MIKTYLGTTALTRLIIAASLVIGLSAPFSIALAASDDIKNDLELIKKELNIIKNQLNAIKTDLAKRPAAANNAPPEKVISKVKTEGSPTLGQDDAPITIVEFSDYECPFCRKHFKNTFGKLKEELVDTGKVKYVFRDLPLTRIHKRAFKAAEATHCAGDQGKYWEMHDLMFENQRTLTIENLKLYARSIKGVSGDDFDSCLDTGKYADKVQSDIDAAGEAGVRGTPGFFVGKSTADGTITGEYIRGARSLEGFKKVVDDLMAKK